MNCNCIKELREVLKKEYGAAAEFTNVGMCFDRASGTIHQAPEPIRFRYHPLTAEDKLSLKWTTMTIAFSFCPICGKSTKEKKRASK